MQEYKEVKISSIKNGIFFKFSLLLQVGEENKDLKE